MAQPNPADGPGDRPQRGRRLVGSAGEPAGNPRGFAWVQAIQVQAMNVENAPVIAAPPAPASAPVPPPSSTGAPMATATTAVNMRTGPSTDYPVLGVAQTGASAEIAGVSQDGGWWQVKVSTSASPDGLAWVSGDYTYAVNTANVPVVAAPPPPEPVEVPPPPADTDRNLGDHRRTAERARRSGQRIS